MLGLDIGGWAILMYKLQHLEDFRFALLLGKTCLSASSSSRFSHQFPVPNKNLSCFRVANHSTQRKHTSREFDRVGCLFPLKLLLRVQIAF